jgi:hypothetical protein
MEELQFLEPDEQGWEVVYKNNIFYEKKTFKTDKATVTVYSPIAVMKKKKN